MTEEFDFDKALKTLQSGRAITGKDGVLTPLIKQLTEAALLHWRQSWIPTWRRRS